MKKLPFLLLLTITCQKAKSQISIVDRVTYSRILDSAVSKLQREISDPDRLVSEYSFRKLARNDFSVILTGDQNKTTVGRYASLELNQNEQTVNLTPITIINGNDPLRSTFHWIHSVDLSGSINSSGFFDFSDRKKVSGSYNVTYVQSKYKFWGNDKTDHIDRKPDLNSYNNIYASIRNQYQEKIDNLKSTIDSLDILDIATDTNKLKQSFLDKIYDYETLLTKNKFTRKKVWWFKANFNIFSWDLLNIVASNDTSTFLNPINRTIYNPSFQLSYNRYIGYRDGGNFYFNLWAKIGVKHNLSEISSTTEWKSISPLTDSAYLINDSKDVYVLQNATVKTKTSFDFGGQVIYILPSFSVFKYATPGIDLSTSFKSFVSEDNASTSYANVSIIGIIIPLKDKEDKNAINIEPFFQRKTFIKYDKKAKNIFGIKFSLPFNKLF